MVKRITSLGQIYPKFKKFGSALSDYVDYSGTNFSLGLNFAHRI